MCLRRAHRLQHGAAMLKTNKLRIQHETIRQLDTADLDRAIGGTVIGTVAPMPHSAKCPVPTPTAGCTTHS